jgi:hypothetical protein
MDRRRDQQVDQSETDPPAGVAIAGKKNLEIQCSDPNLPSVLCLW